MWGFCLGLWRISRKLASVQVVAHSVGTWNAYEFLMLARSQGLPMPKHLFLSAMASPDIPEEMRPWRRNSSLDEEAFKVFQSYHILKPLLRHAPYVVAALQQ